MYKRLPQPVSFTTARLHLRPLVVEDAPTLYEIMADPETLRYFNLTPFSTLAACQAYVRALLRKQCQGQLICWGIEQLDQYRLIGRIFLKHLGNETQRAQITYMLSRNTWGKGYMTEALQTVLSYCFEQTPSLCVEARCWKENQASVRVLTKVGMCCEGLVPEYYFSKGADHEVLLFRLEKARVDDLGGG
ncbi:GNAT family N-acetyltransferase [Ktedonobacter robiniae]|uniref:N-acetyltransferase n=1 Tax=Ktedonobacter robiniae TaxID=2778365 RepID=A0ABQ3V3X5_9CHLR|nr:GNAT family N-acetyltransferase [Ktedonobacter robiniae]GHO59262.1 N-acetyltransferase [Ktedonobacter robiniae]